MKLKQMIIGMYLHEENGQYDINTCESNCNTVIYVYDYCTGLVPSDYNDGTIYYNDDLCGVQSQVFPLMSEVRPITLESKEIVIILIGS